MDCFRVHFRLACRNAVIWSSAWAGSPGAVPPGTLLLAKSPSETGHVDLSWGAACSTTADLYAIYEGELGSFESHIPIDCSVPGTSHTLEPLSDDRYYLVVPNSERFGIEGSYGTTSDGSERPASTLACRTHVPHACP